LSSFNIFSLPSVQYPSGSCNILFLPPVQYSFRPRAISSSFFLFNILPSFCNILGVCAILLGLYTSMEVPKRVYTSPKPILKNMFFQINYSFNYYLQCYVYSFYLKLT
jgi:hypothetical protein